GDEAEPGPAAEGLARGGVAQRVDLRDEADEGQRPDAEPDPGDEVEHAGERGQRKGTQSAHRDGGAYHRRVTDGAWPSCSTRPPTCASGWSCCGGCPTASTGPPPWRSRQRWNATGTVRSAGSTPSCRCCASPRPPCWTSTSST